MLLTEADKITIDPTYYYNVYMYTGRIMLLSIVVCLNIENYSFL